MEILSVSHGTDQLQLVTSRLQLPASCRLLHLILINAQEGVPFGSILVNLDTMEVERPT